MNLETPRPTPLDRPGALRRVLAASFLDAPGATAAVRAARLPLASGARILALHVRPPWSLRPRPGSEPDGPAAAERVAAAARAAARRAGNPEVEVVPALADGWPAAEIVRAAWLERAELVVVGSPLARAAGATRRTVSRVLRQADLPLLVARDDPAREYQRVLCAVDRSVTAIETIELAARLAPRARAFTLFHAYQPAFERWVGRGAREPEAEALAYVRDLAREVADAVAITRAVVHRGEPALEIVRAAAVGGADLIVVGTHARSGWSRALLGSGAEWVIANAPFDVAVARPHRATLER